MITTKIVTGLERYLLMTATTQKDLCMSVVVARVMMADVRRETTSQRMDRFRLCQRATNGRLRMR
jgi:hypothetical protein